MKILLENLKEEWKKSTYKEAFDDLNKVMYHKRRIRVYKEKCGMEESKDVDEYNKWLADGIANFKK